MDSVESPYFVEREEASATREFKAALRANQDLKPGDVLAYIKSRPSPERDYSTVQCGPLQTDNIILESDLVFANHSCEPNTEFDLSHSDPHKWHVRVVKPIARGEQITFFYPSTEWDMAQAFECRCGTPSCLRSIRGARYLTREQLHARGFVSPWIVQLVAQRDAGAAKSKL